MKSHGIILSIESVYLCSGLQTRYSDRFSEWWPAGAWLCKKIKWVYRVQLQPVIVKPFILCPWEISRWILESWARPVFPGFSRPRTTQPPVISHCKDFTSECPAASICFQYPHIWKTLFKFLELWTFLLNFMRFIKYWSSHEFWDEPLHFSLHGCWAAAPLVLSYGHLVIEISSSMGFSLGKNIGGC